MRMAAQRRFVARVLGPALLVTGCLAGPSLAVSLTGEVVSRDGKPAPGAEVALFYDHDGSGYGSSVVATTRADAEGRFRFSDIRLDVPPVALNASTPGRLMALARDAEGRFGAADAIPPLGEACRVVLSTRGVTCTVTDERGRPVAGATVRLAGATSDPRAWHVIALPSEGPWALCGKSGRDGRVPLTGLPEGELHLAAGAEGFAAAVSLADARAKRIRIKLTSSMLITGTVRDANGKPQPGALVHLHGHPGDASWTAVDARGRYELAVPLRANRLITLVAQSASRNPGFAPNYAFAAPAPAQHKMTIDFRLPRGRRITGTVLDAGGKPLCGAPVQITAGTGTPGMFLQLCRRTDAQGRYHACVPDAEVYVAAVAVAPQGHVCVGELPAPVRVAPPLDPTAVDFSLRFARATSVPILVRTARGAAASKARVMWPGGPPSGLEADLGGKANVRGVPAGHRTPLYVVGRFGREAALRVIKPSGHAMPLPVDVSLRRASRATVFLRDTTGMPVKGSVRIWAAGAEVTRPGVPVGPTLRHEATEAGVVVPGLLPGLNYIVTGVVPDHRPAGKFPLSVLRLIGDGEEAQHVLAFRGPRRPKVTPPPAPQPQWPFPERVAALGSPLRRAKDAVQPELTWYVLDGSFALVDEKSKRAQRFDGFFGYGKVKVSDFAFGKNKVWLATDVGLFAWDRKGRFWTRFAVKALYVDVPITDISIDARNRLHLTMRQKRKKPRRFIYDPDTMKWREVR